jgi:Icc protein
MSTPTGELAGIVPYARLEQLLSTIRQQIMPQHPMDLTVITGDASQDGSPASYQLLRELFAAWPTPVFLLPGNHDQPEVMAQLFPPSEQPQQGTLYWQSALVAGAWQFVFLDSGRCLPGMDPSVGWLHEREQAKLAQRLAQHPELFTAVCLHHPVVAVGTPWLDQIGLLNAPELTRHLCDQGQVRLVLFGHIHQEFDTWQGAIRLLGTPSTALQFAHGTGSPERILDRQFARLLTLQPDGTLSTRLFWFPCMA